jgi:hypothetical protein
MRYIDVRWLHQFKYDPIRLVSELDADNFETRKLEFFRDGNIGFADENGNSFGVELGEVPVPALDEINSDVQFDGVEISEAYFEKIWACATAI